MSQVLVIAEHGGGQLNPSTAKCVTCARGIAGAEIVVAVLAAQGAAVCAQAAALEGVTRVLRVDHPANAHPLTYAIRAREHLRAVAGL